MGQEKTTRTPRIEVVDALRGLAILGIVLIHNIEHFNLYDFPETNSALLKTLNTSIWDSIFFLFAGKAYAIFALLFGFSFFIQYNNRLQKGEDFCGRYLWRLCLLAGFGVLNAIFYPGDILILYAIIGIILLPVRKLSNTVVLITAIVLMLLPLEIGKLLHSVFHPDFIPVENTNNYWDMSLKGMKAESLGETIKANLIYGESSCLRWMWENGRFFQTASLFMLGMLLGRKKYFANSKPATSFWTKTLIIAVILFIPLHLLRTYLPGMEIKPGIDKPLQVMVASWTNVSFMAILVSSFVLLWYHTRTQRILSYLVPYGKMSLTNYISAGIIGSFLYFGYGLALYKYLGVTFSLLLGIAMFLIQLGFSKWWLKSHKQGPLESIWHKLTWIKS